MKRLFFVRHGESHMNVAGLLSGQTETPLTPKGIKQAKATGQQIKISLPHIDQIVCSPFERAYETSRFIAHEIGYPVKQIIKSDMFMERTWGILEGTSAKEFLASHDYKEFDTVEGAETIEALDDRAGKALQYLKSLPADNILVVGHGLFGRSLRRAVKQLPYTHEYEQHFHIDNADIVELI
jgi:broad specificity phosphatase PhoE